MPPEDRWHKRRDHIIPYLSSRGYDAVKYRDDGPYDTYMVFSPEQIKSATGNRGTFDPASPRILDSVGRRIVELAKGDADSREVVELGRVSRAVSDTLKALGFDVPAGTPHVAGADRIRHVHRAHPDLSDAELAAIPRVVQSPDFVGATKNKQGFQRIWLLKQGEGDRLHVAVWGAKRGEIRMLTHFKEERGVILRDLKMKGVPLGRVANSLVPPAEAVRPDSQSGLSEPGTTPEGTIPRPAPDGNLLDSPRFTKVNAPRPGQKGWGDGEMSARAERAIAEGKRTARMIADDYGIPQSVVESTLRTREWHHVLRPGRKTPDEVHFYDFQPDSKAEEYEGDADLLAEMRDKVARKRKAAAGKAAFSREIKRRGFAVKAGEVFASDGTRVGLVAGAPGAFGVELYPAINSAVPWERVAPLADLARDGDLEMTRERYDSEVAQRRAHREKSAMLEAFKTEWRRKEQEWNAETRRLEREKGFDGPEEIRSLMGLDATRKLLEWRERNPDIRAAHRQFLADRREEFQRRKDAARRALGEGDPASPRILDSVGQRFRDTSLPEDTDAPVLLNARVPDAELLRAAADTFKSWPKETTAADGARILLRNPEAGTLARRLAHMAKDNNTNTVAPEKAAWIPNVPATLEHAQARLGDADSGNKVYVRKYAGGGQHFVVVRPDGTVEAQRAWSGQLITQFPHGAGRQGGFRIEWERAEPRHGVPGADRAGRAGSLGQDPNQTHPAADLPFNSDAPTIPRPAPDGNTLDTVRPESPDVQEPPRPRPAGAASTSLPRLRALGLPELTDLARQLMGAPPEVRKTLPHALGRFWGTGAGEIALRADIFAGPVVGWMGAGRKRPTQDIVDAYRMQKAEALGVEPGDIIVNKQINRRKGEYLLVAQRRDHDYARSSTPCTTRAWNTRDASKATASRSKSTTPKAPSTATTASRRATPSASTR